MQNKKLFALFALVLLFAVVSPALAARKFRLIKAVITGVDGFMITAAKNNDTYVINAQRATLRNAKGKRATIDQFFAGDQIDVKGTQNNGTITAKTIKDRSLKPEELSRRSVGSENIKEEAISDLNFISNGVITEDKLQVGTITNTSISPSASIDISKLNLAGAVTSAMIADETIVGSNLALNISISTTGDVSAGNLTLTGTADVTGNVNTDTLYQINSNTILSNSGSGNILVGVGAGQNNTGSYLTAVGYNAGYSNTADQNTFIGYRTGEINSTGNKNTFIGYHAGLTNTTGYGNIFIGLQTGDSNVSGNNNVFIGNYTGGDFQANNNNVFVGQAAGYHKTGGGNNTLIGYGAGVNNQTGSNNIFVGYQAGSNETGSGKLYIDNSDTSSPLIYGDLSSDILAFNGSIGIGTTNPQTTLSVNGQVNLKKNSSQPYACDATHDGDVALTNEYTTCVCKNGSGWVLTSDGTTACTWD